MTHHRGESLDYALSLPTRGYRDADEAPAKRDTIQAAFWAWVSETPLCRSCGRRLVRRAKRGNDGQAYDVLTCPGTAGKGFACSR